MVDSIWLASFVAQAPSRKVAVQHGCIYCVSFVSLTSTVSLITYGMREGLSSTSSSTMTILKNDDLWEVLGAVLCWSLAGLLYYKSWLKKAKKQQNNPIQSDVVMEKDAEVYVEMVAKSEDGKEEEGEVFDSLIVDSPTDDEVVEHQGAQPYMVVSLTIAGSLDEVSYYPALILGNVFSVAELIIGTVLSALTLLLFVSVFLTQCRPALDLINRIPLYVVVTLFSIFITCELLWDML